jgi:hypothetical protein
MVKTVHIRAEVPENREVKVTLPPEVPPGPADLVVVISFGPKEAPPKLGDLLLSEFFGSWRDRDDIGDSCDFAKRLRAEAWKRPS